MSGELHFDIHDAAGDLLVSLDDAFEKEFKAEFNAPGYGKFAIASDDVAATAANLAQGNTVRVYCDDIGPEAIGEFFIETGDFALISAQDEGGQVLRFSGPGTLTYLRRAVLDFTQYLGTTELIDLTEGLWRWDTETEGNIIRRIIDEAQNRDLSGEGIVRVGTRPSDPIPLLERTFDANVDTDGTSWGDEQLEGNYTATIGSSVYDEVLRFAQMGFLQVEMEPGYIIDARRNDRADADKTGAFGAGNIRFEKAVNIATDLSRRALGRRYGSDAIVRGYGTYARAAVTPSPASWVQEVYAEFPSDTAATLERAGEGLLGFSQDAQDGIQLEVTPPLTGDASNEATGLYWPGPNWTSNGLYWVGDLVTLHTGSGEVDYNAVSFRLVGITLREDPAGGLAPPIIELGGSPALLPSQPFTAPGTVDLSDILRRLAALEACVSCVFDDFNRTVAPDGWGVASSGPTWTSSPSGGTTLGVDGSSGYATMTSGSGNSLTILGGPTTAAGFVYTMHFSVDDVAASGVGCLYDIEDNANGNASFLISVASTAGGGGGYMTVYGSDGNDTAQKDDWVADTDYIAKWSYVPGDTSKLKVWAASDPEPGTWDVEVGNSTGPAWSGTLYVGIDNGNDGPTRTGSIGSIDFD